MKLRPTIAIVWLRPSESQPAMKVLRRRPSRSRAAWTLLALAGFVSAIQLGTLCSLDHSPRLRDPEYGRRLTRLRARTAENPGRPLVLILGSSRVSMGVRPAVLEPAAGQPLIFNFSLTGSGPIMELLAFRRALADGVNPDAVLVEFWPALWHEEGRFHEAARFDPARIRPGDDQTIRECFPDPNGTERVEDRLRRSPVFGHRRSLMNQFAPSWLPSSERSDSLWNIDDWGWLPGRISATDAEIEAGRQASASYYVPLFAKYEVSPVADGAIRRLVAECRERGIPVALVYLPETAAFRAFATPSALARAEAYLAQLRADLSLPLIDSRNWMTPAHSLDGFHLTQAGAAEYTRRLAPAVGEAFPGLTPAVP